MSYIVASEVLVPDLSDAPRRLVYPHPAGEVVIERTLTLPEDGATLVDLPQPRSLRSLSRAGLMLNAVGLRMRSAIEPFIANDPFRVGIYCAVENGPDHFPSVAKMLHTPSTEFAATYRSLRSPKQHFRLLPNVPASYLSIFLQINGPLFLFNHSCFAVEHALDQAEFDLGAGLLDAALVCSAFSLENPMISIRTAMHAPPGSTLCEGAACLLLAADGHRTARETSLQWPADHFFGIADPLLGLLANSTMDLLAGRHLSERMAGAANA